MKGRKSVPINPGTSLPSGIDTFGLPVSMLGFPEICGEDLKMCKQSYDPLCEDLCGRKALSCSVKNTSQCPYRGNESINID